ncbi:hypothetical protein Adt_27627 [Abeliophyllum distichum]|uniref:Uncharacterized protein n=1 Tax=Abeliophyllum distichum TaxID=126358 RepID=A0ABD1RVG1_9LAMI
MHPFFHEVLKDWNLAPCQITPNGWSQMVASYLLWVVAEVRNGEQPLTVPTRCTTGMRDYGKPPILKRNQGELRSKWGKVRALSSDFRSLNNLLKDDNLLASCRLMAFRFKGVPVLRLSHPASGEGSSEQVSRHEASGPSQEVQDATVSSTIPPPCPEADANIHQRPPSSSNFHIDSTTLRDKEKKLVERTEEAPAQKRKAPAATESLIRDDRKARRTEEGRRSSPSLDGKPEGASNSMSSAGQSRRFRISEHREELPTSVMEMLPAHPSIVAVSVHRYWTPSWEKVVEEVTVLERLQLAEVNLVRGLVLAKDIFSAFTSFDVEEFKSKKLVEDLKAMGLEKAQLESDKRAIQFKLDLVVTKEANMKANYEIELKAAKECLKQAWNQRRAAEASQKRANEAQNSLEAASVDNERSFATVKLELEKVKAERADVEAKAVEAYREAFIDTPEYQDLAQRLMTVDGEQLVERIMEAHPEWDLSFLREAPAEAHTSKAGLGDTHGRDEGPFCVDP